MRPSLNIEPHQFSLDSLTPYQQLIVKGFVVNMDDRFNEVFLAFDPLNKKFSPSSRIIDSFSNYFLFHSFKISSNKTFKTCLHLLNNLIISSSLDFSHVLMVTNTSIKNNATTSIVHIHVCDKAVTKTIHHTVNILTTETKLFAIRCGINQATSILGISKIVVITDLLHAAWRIFDFSLCPHQIHTVSILNELRRFFIKNCNNSIEFWKCPSWCDWSLHKAVDTETKQFHPQPLYPCKLSWDFIKKNECDNILSSWKMTFQALDLKGHHFLDLCNEYNNPFEPTYAKDSSWLKYFGHSNSLCVRATRVIVNHAPIGEYRLRFFPWKDFSCPCGSYPLESRHHILHKCRRFNAYWNLRRDSISHFVLFLEFNSSAFLFRDAISWVSFCCYTIFPFLFLVFTFISSCFVFSLM